MWLRGARVATDGGDARVGHGGRRGVSSSDPSSLPARVPMLKHHPDASPIVQRLLRGNVLHCAGSTLKCDIARPVRRRLNGKPFLARDRG
jgi:hypothetical protein